MTNTHIKNTLLNTQDFEFSLSRVFRVLGRSRRRKSLSQVLVQSCLEISVLLLNLEQRECVSVCVPVHRPVPCPSLPFHEDKIDSVQVHLLLISKQKIFVPF